MFVYDLKNNKISEVYREEGILFNLKDVLLSNNSIYIPSDKHTNFEFTTALIDFRKVYYTYDLYLYRNPLEELLFTVYDNLDNSVDYTIPSGVVKIDLAKGFKSRYMKFKIKYKGNTKVNIYDIRLNLVEASG